MEKCNRFCLYFLHLPVFRYSVWKMLTRGVSRSVEARLVFAPETKPLNSKGSFYYDRYIPDFIIKYCCFPYIKNKSLVALIVAAENKMLGLRKAAGERITPAA